MPKSEFQKHTLNFFSGDVQRLQELYPDIGASIVIRTIVRKFIEKIEREGTTPTDVNVEL